VLCDTTSAAGALIRLPSDTPQYEVPIRASEFYGAPRVTRNDFARHPARRVP
jgi:hypothetical protein